MSWLPDISIITGVILLALGLYFVYFPLALIIPGIFLIYIGWPAKGVKQRGTTNKDD